MGLYGFVAVSIGAALGACLRWWLGHRMNGILPTLPLGTLSANLLGGFLVGIAVTLFEKHPGLPPELRLMAITGFLGGLTTFSTFSAEVVALLERSEYGWGLAAASAHVFGSLALTVVGIAVTRLALAN